MDGAPIIGSKHIPTPTVLLLISARHSHSLKIVVFLLKKAIWDAIYGKEILIDFTSVHCNLGSTDTDTITGATQHSDTSNF